MRTSLLQADVGLGMCLAAAPASFLPAACILVAVLASITAVLSAREGAFYNYYERDLNSSHWAPEQVSASPSEGSRCRDQHAACKDWADKGECQRNLSFMAQSCRASCTLCTPVLPNPVQFEGHMLVLVTAYGSIRITPLWHTAPRTSLLMMDLAAQDSTSKSGCKFYRNEAVPSAGSAGPPYGLLQGSMPGTLEVPPPEPSPTQLPTRGAVAMIGGADFYISLMDHSDWGKAHTVWGWVLDPDMGIVDTVVQSAPYQNFTHPTYGTVMRLMLEDVMFEPVLQPLESTLQDTAEL